MPQKGTRGLGSQGFGPKKFSDTTLSIPVTLARRCLMTETTLPWNLDATPRNRAGHSF